MGITYFKLISPYEGDITKNCALTGSEVDNNFLTLEGRDIQSVEVEDGKVVINLLNGTQLTTDSVTDDCVKDLTFEFDKINGVLTITQDGVTQTIAGFATNYNIQEGSSVDGSIIGNGLPNSPLGISPAIKTGQYRPVKDVIKINEGESLPTYPNVFPGDRYLTVENVSGYGLLYNYEGITNIACLLNEIGSQWRIPTKEDWDDMLNAVEPDEMFRTHSDARTNKYLGKFAGKFLKSQDKWRLEEEAAVENTNDSETCNTNELCSCGNNIPCTPSYCGEYSECQHRGNHDNRGIDKYGFDILPSGYANEAKDYLYFGERAYFWTATNHDCRDAYTKIFTYNSSQVLQDIMASDNYMSLRLVKNYDGNNYEPTEEILGGTYPTVLMPSMQYGKTIWTSINLYVPNSNGILPNGGSGIDVQPRFFINEWTGRRWQKKEVLDGESVVVIKDIDEQSEIDTSYSEYRVINGELKNVAQPIYDNVMETITPYIRQIETTVDNVVRELGEESERAIAKENELQNSINALSERVTVDEQKIEENEEAIQTVSDNLIDSVNTLNETITSAVNVLNTSIETEREVRANKDTELETAINTERDERISNVTALQEEDVLINEHIEELEQKIDEIETQLIQEGSEFDKDTGILTLKSKSGTSDILIQFDFNFGTF